jgi:hypothetical protein
VQSLHQTSSYPKFDKKKETSSAETVENTVPAENVSLSGLLATKCVSAPVKTNYSPFLPASTATYGSFISCDYLFIILFK